MPDLQIEIKLQTAGHLLIAGIDEAGTGPFAGPVAAAAVILPVGYKLKGLNDSKQISPRKREALYQTITTDPRIQWAVATASHTEIDEINILKASHLAMERAVRQLNPVPDHCIIDGYPVMGFSIPHTNVIKGDTKSLSIAAASIIAKVTRDRIMVEIDKEFPKYGFARHKGYGTIFHYDMLREYGPCPYHRKSVKTVAMFTKTYPGWVFEELLPWSVPTPPIKKIAGA